MLTQGESVEAHVLRERGWSVSAIARHLGRDRKTVRAYLSGKREPGRRRPAAPDRFERYEAYCGIRFGDDPHLWATTLFDEVAGLGYDGSYPSFTRALRRHGLRPRCDACAAAGTPAEFAVIDHPPGEETQWDWVELPDPPPSWGQGKHAHLLVGALSHSGAWRGVLAESEEQPYLVASLHAVCGRLGGVARRWRFDRMSAVCHPESGDVTASFAEVAKYYGAGVDVCPSRRGWRKGVVEKANHSAAQRWWRTLPDDVTPAQAQARLDAWCAGHGDARRRVRDGERTTVGALMAAEPLMLLPAVALPAVIEDTRVGSPPAPRGPAEARRSPDAGRAADAPAGGAVPRGDRGHAGGVGAGAGVLARERVLGAAGARRAAGHCPAPARRGDDRRGDGGRDGAGPAPPRRRPRRRGGPRRRSCRRAGEEGAGRPRAGRPAVPPQGAAPAVGVGAGESE